MIIPYWLINYLTTAAYDRVAQAIKAAEAKTHAEIVPMIVRSSRTQAPGLYAFLGLILFFIFLYSPSLVTLISIGCAVLIILYFREQQIDAWVYQRAQIEFLNLDLNQTEDNQGVLIFVSMVERRVEIVFDKNLQNLLSPAQINLVEAELQRGLKTRELGASLVRAIDLLGKILAQVAPNRHLDVDEINNILIIKD